MASGPNLPPQAYTREMLTSAFNWLQTQPESVRKLATTPDTLVGIYSRAKRFGNSSLEADAPVSSQNFMSDLKNLAEGLREFEGPKEAPAKRPMTNGFYGASSAKMEAPPLPPPLPVFSGESAPARENRLAAEPAPAMMANERTRAMIQEVKTSLNLSNDGEAVNMMVAVAYKTLKNLLP